MKKYLLIAVTLLLSILGNSQTNIEQGKKNETNVVLTKKQAKKLRKKHARFLANSPYKKTQDLSKQERKTAGLPPNKFYERQWELSINPATGQTEPENVFKTQSDLTQERLTSRTPGDLSNNAWIERGPNNVGGRTRALLFDPNDFDKNRVFAGSASGGLWVNNDIINNSSWTRVAGVPGNLNVSCITVDPIDSNTWYLGTGEVYTSGDCVGNGLYKTTDGGTTWVNVPITYSGTNFNFNATVSFVAGTNYITDIIARNNAGTTELYVGVGSAIYGSGAVISSYNGPEQAGIYKTSNGGTTWSRFTDATLQTTNTGGKQYYVNPNDLELDANNNIWATCTRDVFGLGGGRIYRSTNGTSWTLVRTLATASRTELEPSTTNANKFYVLYRTTGTGTPPAIAVTNDAFATVPTAITQPDDADTGISATDFTRGQAFYDLTIECDPIDDNILYIGGIDLFRSINGGTNWTQISKWSNNNNLAALPCSNVHADQHVMTFRPGFPNEAVFGNDGGVYYASSLSTSGTSAVIPARNTNYNVTQFYSVGVSPTGNGLPNDNFLAGAQDNGTQYFDEATTAATTSTIRVQGGDGAYSFFSQDVTDLYFISNYVYNSSINLYNFASGTYNNINNESASNGDFICPMALDSNLDLLYADYTSGATYRIIKYSDIKTTTPSTKTILTDASLTGEPTALRVSKYTTASSTLLVGTDKGTVLLVANADTAAPQWTNITGPSFVGSVSDVEFGQDENQIFVTFHNYGVTSIWYSMDSGVTWASIEGNFPNIPVKCILQNPLNTSEIIIGTDLGVWYTNGFNPALNTAQALTWNQSYNGMSDVKVFDLQLRNDNTVFAATYGRGVFSGVFTGNTLSVDQNDVVSNTFNVFPTVSNGDISILSNKYFGKTELNLFDLTGKKVYSNNINITNSEQKVNLGNLSAGNYILKLSGDGFEGTKRIIIQ
ncbi:MAG: T9SS type A sorting domain-containing protein [Bacteroidota bacterium]